MGKSNKIFLAAIAVAMLLALVVSGVSLWRNRPTSKGDPSQMTEERFAPETPTDEDIPLPAIRETQTETKELDLDVRDYAPQNAPARVVDEQIVYDRKEIPG